MAETLKRAYALIESKDVNDGDRVLRGIATSASVDRMGDVILAEGVRMHGGDIPLFLYHDSTKTVGRAKFGKPTKDGIPFEARLPKVTEDGTLKQRVDEAWQMCRYGLITAVSVGFRPMDDAYEIMKNGGIKFLEIEVLELSLVPVPAQPDAVIQSIKSADPAARSALIQQIKTADQTARRSMYGAHGTRTGVGHATGKSGSPEVSGTHRASRPFFIPE